MSSTLCHSSAPLSGVDISTIAILSAQQLGSVYERLIKHEVVRDGHEISASPNVFKRKGSGIYFTLDDFLGLIVHKTVGPLVDSRLRVFKDAIRRDETGMRARPTETENWRNSIPPRAS